MKLPRTFGLLRRLAGRRPVAALASQGRRSGRHAANVVVAGLHWSRPCPHRAVREARSRCSTFAFGNYPTPLHELSNGLSIAATFPPRDK